MQNATIEYSAKDVARLLGVQLITFREMCSKDEFPLPARSTHGAIGLLWTHTQLAPWLAMYAMHREAQAQRSALIAEAKAARLAARHVAHASASTAQPA